MIVNLWRYRGFIVRNALSDARHRYAGSAAGVAWNVINPLAQILIYSVVFSQIMAVRLPGAGSGAESPDAGTRGWQTALFHRTHVRSAPAQLLSTFSETATLGP